MTATTVKNSTSSPQPAPADSAANAAGPRIVVLYFARLREELGCDRESLSLPTADTTVASLRAFLRSRGGAWATALAPECSVRVAVDQVMVTGDPVLADGNEVAFFPPVTGG